MPGYQQSWSGHCQASRVYGHILECHFADAETKETVAAANAGLSLVKKQDKLKVDKQAVLGNEYRDQGKIDRRLGQSEA